MKPFIVVISGPTAIGKTEISMKLSKIFPTEIVNADSMQVYRYLDIGTAKPSLEERKEVVHHLIDIVDPDEPFDAGSYKTLADRAIQDIWSRKKIPLVVGGTGLYIRALTRGLCHIELDNARKEEVRKRLAERLRNEGIYKLYQELMTIDPLFASKLSSTDRQRILRSLEVFLLTGKPFSSFHKEHGFSDEPYDSLKIFLYTRREDVYRRIDLRVLEMIEKGLCEEVRDILSRGYSPYLKPLQSIGYKQIIEHLQGKLSLDDAIRSIQVETRRYAKRQFTWFKREPGFLWVEREREEEVFRLVEEAIKRFFSNA